MEEITIVVEIEGEAEQSDRYGIEDKVYDALVELGFKVTKVKVVWH